tara:strand:- start:87 stop:305 length:219 start_codon:yes stop_codon:yes gene_type:complete
MSSTKQPLTEVLIMSINYDDEFHGTINYGNNFPKDWYLNDPDDDLVEMKIHCGEYVPDSNELIADSLEVGGL